MPRITEALGPPQRYFTPADSPSPIDSTPSSDRSLNPAYSDSLGSNVAIGENSASDEHRRVTGLVESGVVARLSSAELKQLARDAGVELDETLSPTFVQILEQAAVQAGGEVPTHGEVLRIRGRRWDVFMSNGDRGDALTKQREELGTTIWLAVKAVVEKAYGISHKAPELLRRPRRG